MSDTYNNRLRRIDNSGIIHTIIGNGIGGYSGDNGLATSAEINSPYGIAFDTCGNLYFADANNNRIRKVSFNPSCLPLKTPQAIKNQITIYPNPATETLNIDGITTTTQYSLLNITGNQEQAGTLKAGANSVDIAALPPGVYMLKMSGHDGAVTIKKVVKE
jgi:sugar lactone lactonase YvrE